MRKQYKRKKRSCALCKPHKTGGEKRWHISDQRRGAAAAQQEQQEVGLPERVD